MQIAWGPGAAQGSKLWKDKMPLHITSLHSCAGKGRSTQSEAASEQLLFPSPVVHPAALGAAVSYRLCNSTSTAEAAPQVAQLKPCNTMPCALADFFLHICLIRSLSKWWSRRLASASSPPPHSTYPRSVLLPPARTSPEEPCGCPFGA